MSNTPHLSISHAIPVHHDTLGQVSVDLVVLPECVRHTQFQAVKQLLACSLHHTLREVPEVGWGRSRERKEERTKEHAMGEKGEIIFLMQQKAPHLPFLHQLSVKQTFLR